MVLLSAGALVRRGHSVTVILPNNGPLAAMLEAVDVSVVIEDLPVLRKSDMAPIKIANLLWKLFKSQVKMLQMISTVNPNVVYVNTIVQPWWVLSAKIMRRPVVIHVRESESQVNVVIKTLLNLPLIAANAIVCNSHSTRLYIKQFRPLAGKRIEVIYNGKDWSSYRIIRDAGDQNGDDSNCRLTLVGRLNPRKGQDIALRALAVMLKAGRAATLTLVGDVFPGYEWYEAELKKFAEELGVERRVTFLGFQEDIRPALSRTDIALVPSRVEPFGTVAAECMAAGIFTVVSDVQGLAEIVENGVTGMTFRSEDPIALAECCTWAITHPQEAASIASRGQRHIGEKFRLETYEEELVKVIESYERT